MTTHDRTIELAQWLGSVLTEGILIVFESEGDPVCLFVDELLGQQETVIKGMSEYLGDSQYVSGCTILGDGDVSLILDVAMIVRKNMNSQNRHSDKWDMNI